jgi:glycosyltransferase involved in cell wall biosynthesis
MGGRHPPRAAGLARHDVFSLQIDTARTWRGGQNQVLLTVQGLSARGHRVAVAAHPDGALIRRLPPGVETVPIAPRHEVDLPAAWRLARAIRELRPEVVHAHDPHAIAMAAAALAMAPPSPAPPLVASRRVDFHLGAHSFSRWKHQRVSRFLAASEAVRRMLIEDGVEPDRVVTVHEGIDVDRVAAVEPLDVREAFWLPRHSIVVGNIAALVPHKGQKVLVEAAALVAREAPEARFLIVGEGELRETLEHQVRHLRLAGRVVLTGFRADALRVLKGLDLFVMSSITEGLGTSLLDAMAAGCPIVATRTGGIPEVVVDGETGLLVPPRDAPALARAILDLLADPGRRRRFADAGRARVRERFTADRMVEQTLAVYAAEAGTTRAAGSASPPTAG